MTHPDRHPTAFTDEAMHVGSHRVLYWWPAPVSPHKSADVGREMLFFCVSWLVGVVAAVGAIAIVLAATA